MAIWASEKEAWDFAVRVVQRFLASDVYQKCGRHNQLCTKCEGLGYCIDQAMRFKAVGSVPHSDSERCVRVPADSLND